MHTISEKSSPKASGWNRTMNLPNLAAGKRANLLVFHAPFSYTPNSPCFSLCGLAVFQVYLTSFWMETNQGAADEAVQCWNLNNYGG